jgi:peptidoglycan/LPS O-acetylase OafA/YrhL
MVDAAIGGARRLDAAMIGAAGALLRSLRRSISRLLMLLLCGFLLLTLLLCGFRLLMLLPLLRFGLLLFLLLTLCVGRSNGSEKKEQNSRTDKTH